MLTQYRSLIDDPQFYSCFPEPLLQWYITAWTLNGILEIVFVRTIHQRVLVANLSRRAEFHIWQDNKKCTCSSYRGIVLELSCSYLSMFSMYSYVRYLEHSLWALVHRQRHCTFSVLLLQPHPCKQIRAYRCLVSVPYILLSPRQKTINHIFPIVIMWYRSVLK